MRKIVVDASVAIKWFIPEVHAKAAIRLLDIPTKFLAPDLIYAEVGNILWKKLRSNELTQDAARGILNDFKKIPFEISESQSLLEVAWQIATQHQRTVYDSLYLAVAFTENCQLATADLALVNALKSTSLNPLLLWVETIPKADKIEELQH